ncbi:MAG: SDH family Clp fold serine proteinase [Pseudonocardiales bacterium]
MEAGTKDDEAQAAAAGAPTTDSGSTGSVASRSAGTPLFLAQHEDRYLRRDLIKDYQRLHGCNLVVLIDQITQDSITLFAELLHGLDRSQDLHLLLASPGGDGGAAVRLARMAQAACRELVVIVPEMAKSAATILALGAHSIVMGPTSDLGPIDPQILMADRGFVSAKDLIEAVNSALDDVATRPDTYPLHAAMLAGIDSTAVQFARSALASTDELAEQAIGSNPDRTRQGIRKLCMRIHRPLIDQPKTHSAVIGSGEARKAGLPVVELEADTPWWQEIWHLWTRYYALGPIHLLSAYEGAKASQVRVLRSVGSHDHTG